MLVDRAVPVPPAGVRKVPPHRALKEAFAALAGELAVMFPTGLVPADHAVHVGELVSGKSVVPRGGTVGRPRRPAGFLATYLELGARVCRNALWPLTYYHCHAKAAKFWSPFKPQRKSDLIKDPHWRLGSEAEGGRAGASHFLQKVSSSFSGLVFSAETSLLRIISVNTSGSFQQRRGGLSA